ncbi:MAG: hypothetical protein U0575_02375 [Phycisphaerales bacterium]
MSDTPTASIPRRKGSCLGRLAKTVVVLAILVAALVAFTPMLLSTGPGTRFIEGVVAPNIDGTFSIGKLGLSWFGGQTIDGLRIVGRDGKPAVDLKLGVKNGLLDLARGGWKRIDATVGGAINVERRADGTLNLATLAKARPSGAAPAAAPGKSAAGPVLPAGLDATVRIDELDVSVRDEASAKSAQFRKLSGTVIAGTVRPVSVKLRGLSEFEGKPGELGLEATLENLVQSDGRLGFKGAKANGAATIKNVALPLPQMLVDVTRLTANLESADLTQQIKLLVDGDATLNGNTPSAVHADIVANGLFAPDGAVTFKAEQVAADVAATNLPTALAEPFLKGQPLVASRDIGPTADATIKLPAGGGEMTLTLKAANLGVEARGSVDASTGALSFSKVVATTNVQPALLEAAARLSAAQPIAFKADFDRVVVPGATKDGTRDLGGAGLSGTISLPGTIELSRLVDAASGAAIGATTAGATTTGAGAARTEPLGVARDLTLSLKSTSLRDGLHVGGGGQVEGGTLAIDEKLSNLVDAKGAIDTRSIAAIGTVALTNIDPQRILGALPESQRGLARELLAGPVDARLETSGTASAMDATLALSSGALRADAKAALKGRSLAIQSATASVPATPGLLAALQQGRPKPVQLAQAATVTAAIRPMTIDLDRISSIMTAGAPIVADLAMTPATLAQVPGVTGTVGIAEFKGIATIKPGATLGVLFEGGAKIAASGAPLTTVAIGADVGVPQSSASAPGGAPGASSATIKATIDAKEIQVAALESMLGKKPGDLASILGPTGAILVEASPRDGGVTDVRLKPTFRSATGDIQARLTPTTYEVPSGRIDFSLGVEQLNRYFAPSTPQDQVAPSLVFAAPLNVQVGLEGLSIDQKAIAGEPTDPALTRAKVKATTSPVAMTISFGQTISFQGFSAEIACERLDKGATLVVDGKGAADAAGAVLAVRGSVRNLLDKSSRLDTAGAIVDAQVNARQVPTALLDRFQNLDGLLVTALGELLDGTVDVKGLSRTEGTIAARLSSANGRIDAPQVTLRNNALVVETSKPITGELQITKALRDRLLRDINPVLADIRQTEQPVRLSIPQFIYPLDGDYRRLDGDIELTVGAVEFDTGSQILGFLELFNKKQAPTLPGKVDPLRASIRAGQLAYQDFAINIGKDANGWKHTLKFSGDVDLVQKPPYARAIKSMYPIDGLAKSIKELQKVPLLGLVSAGITFYGPLYDPAGKASPLQYKIDVNVDLPKKPEEILNNPGVKGAIDDIFKKLQKK